MSALPAIEFDIRTPLDEPTIRRHIAHALSLGHREALEQPETLTIVAGGPSALKAPLTSGPTLAVNGSLGLFTAKGLAPTYYAACDPQQHLVDFLGNPPAETTYYIASKCHPDVFKALKSRDVRLWHIDDYIPGSVASAPSITLTALNLFARMGWRRFEVWGWDCCYQDGKHHALDQIHNSDDRTLEVGERAFKTTAPWAAEAQSAIQVLAIFEYLGLEVVIHGDSMVQAIRDFIR